MSKHYIVSDNLVPEGNGSYSIGSGDFQFLNSWFSGTVSIGTTSPTAKLHIKGFDTNTGTYSLKVDDGDGRSMMYLRNDGSVGIGNVITSNTMLDYKGLHIKNDGSSYFSIGNTSSGNTLIFGLEDGAFNYQLFQGGGYFYYGDNWNSTSVYSKYDTVNGNWLFGTKGLGSGNISAYNRSTSAKVTIVGSTNSSDTALEVVSSQQVWTLFDTGKIAYYTWVYSENPLLYVKNNGYVGIGLTAPSTKLEVNGDFKANQIYIPNGTDPILSESGDAVLGFGTGYEFNFTNDGGVGNKGRIQVSDTQAIFGNTYGLIESYTTAGYLTHDQKWIFGVGPNYIMEVNYSGVSASGLSVGTNSNYSGHLLPTEDSAYDLGSSTKKWRSLHVASGSIYIGGVTVSSSNGSIQIPSINLGTTENPVIITSQNNQVSFGPSTSTTFLTNVGMGTTGPSYSLHVVGTTSTTNLRITNGASSSFVLSSDSNGLASWTASYRSQMFSHGSFNPLDATTYYIGDIADLGPTTSNVVARRIKSQFAGSVISVTLLVAIGGTNGTNENTTFEIHNLTTATSSTITSTAQLTADFLTTYTLSTPLTVSANDDLQIRMICPTWVTNPTSVRGRFTARIKL